MDFGLVVRGYCIYGRFGISSLWIRGVEVALSPGFASTLPIGPQVVPFWDYLIGF